MLWKVWESCINGDSIEKTILNKCSKIQNNVKECNGLDKFGNVSDTNSWENDQQRRFMHNSCYITLCSS